MANKRYRLVIKTNSYTGNFHRELNAYVFNYQPDYDPHDWVEKLHKDSIKSFLEYFKDEDFAYGLYHHFYDEYGMNISELSNFAGNGIGTLGITVYFDKNPMEHLTFFLERLKSFPSKLADSHEYSEKNVKIESVELIEETTTEKSLWKS